MAWFACGLGLLLVTGCSGGSGGSATVSASPEQSPIASPSEYAAELALETAAARAGEGLPELSGSACAQSAALQRVTALVGAAELTHAALADVIAECAPATVAAENLSRSAATPAAVVEAWLDSPGHRANLLDPDLTELGVGCVLDGAELLCSQIYLGP